MGRNFALIGHGGDGKTTLADSLIMAAGVTTRLGSVEDGSSYMNWLPEEKARRVSISASLCTFEHDRNSFCVIDAPGDANFAGELTATLNAVDHAVLVLSAQEGVKIGAEKAFKQARERAQSPNPARCSSSAPASRGWWAGAPASAQRKPLCACGQPRKVIAHADFSPTACI